MHSRQLHSRQFYRVRAVPPHRSGQSPRPRRRSQQCGQPFSPGHSRPRRPRPRQLRLRQASPNLHRFSPKRRVPSRRRISRRRIFSHRSRPQPRRPRTCRPECLSSPTLSPPGRWTLCPGAGTFRQQRPRRGFLQRGPSPRLMPNPEIPSPEMISRVPAGPNLLSPRLRSRPAPHRPRRGSPPKPRRNSPGGRDAAPWQMRPRQTQPRPNRPRRVVSFLCSRLTQPSPGRSRSAQLRSLQPRRGSRAAVEWVSPPSRSRAGPAALPRFRP